MVQGVTDVDDKIIARAHERGIPALELAQYYEAEFADQMAALNVKAPTVQARVTEHIPQIVSFIEGIAARGHAYETEWGVYFDTAAFSAEPQHTYGKLQPKRQQAAAESFDAAAAAAAATEGGSGSNVPGNKTVGSSGKKRPADFVLWKPVKPGEPMWDSPWGPGRPGWHIECSAMASTIFGSTLDLHTGGQDLAFPHHENELAQSESHHCADNWCNYFLHSGHVMLQDTKISKSLGNTIGIDEILAKCTASQFRILCLTTKYHQSFNFSEVLLEKAVNIERRLSDFLRACTARTSSTTVGNSESGREQQVRSQQWTNHEVELLNEVATAQEKVSAALRKDFDTPAVLQAMLGLVSSGHRYLVATNELNAGVGINAAASLIGRTLDLLGVELPEWRELERRGWGSHIGVAPQAVNRHDSLAAHQSIPDNAMDAFVKFRSEVRQLAIANIKTPETALFAKELMQACDAVRNDLADPSVGIVVRDSKEGATWHVEK